MPQQQNLAVPIAIVIAGALVAAAMYFGGSGSGAPSNTDTNQLQEASSVPQVTAEDHIKGSASAKVTIVEYTDLECPFCKQFHGTMQQVVDKYASSGNVAWVLRNFPLAQLHPNAPSLALAAECVAELRGNDAYWTFIDNVFIEAPLNTRFDFAKLDKVVASVGLDNASFKTCFETERHRDRVEKDYSDAVASGGNGTPYNVIVLQKQISKSAKDVVASIDAKFVAQGARPGTLAVSKDGKYISMSGSLPLEVVTEIVDALLK